LPTNQEKKRIEAYMLSAAREAGVPIPHGEKHGTEPEPDFIFGNDKLGIELTELTRPADDDGGFVPTAEEAFHKELIRTAQKQYYSASDATPARLVVYFSTDSGKKRDKLEMAGALAEFVKANVHSANPVAVFSGLETPAGVGAMSIASESGDWWSGESGVTTLKQIQSQLAYRISDKNTRVQQYRNALPKCFSVWLLVYSGVAVSRSMPIPHGIEECTFPFEFDKVFWFDCLEGRIAEIRPARAE
jgi:hypothetical protein